MLQAIFPAKVLHVQYINKEFNKSHTDRHTLLFAPSDFQISSFIFVLVPEVTHILQL